MNIRHTLWYIAIFALSINSLPGVTLYTLADLEILEQEKNFREFLAHTYDIRPIERNNHWRNMTYNMGEQYIDDLMKNKEFSSQHMDYLEKIAAWPIFRDNEIFQSKRGQFALAYFKKIIMEQTADSQDSQSKTPITVQIKTFWTGMANKFLDHNLALQLGNLVSKHFPNESLWPFYKPFFKNGFLAKYCERAEIKNSLLEHWASNADPTKIKSFVRNGLSPECWNYIGPFLHNLLTSASAPIDHRIMALKMLKERNDLLDDESDLFLLTYFLDDPPNGPLLNQAWNTVSLLGNKAKRREVLMNHLAKLSNLPGKILKNPDPKRILTLLNHLHRNFPEYLDFYAITCIKYLKGKVKSPAGNPTPECHDLFRFSGGNGWPLDTLKNDYEKTL